MSFNMCTCLWNHHSQDNEQLHPSFSILGSNRVSAPSSELTGKSKSFLFKIVALALKGHLHFTLCYHWRGSSPFDLSVAFPPSPQLQHSSCCLRPLSLLNHPLLINRLLFNLKNKEKQKIKHLFLTPPHSFLQSLIALSPAFLFVARLPEIVVQIHSLHFLTPSSLSKPPLPTTTQTLFLARSLTNLPVATSCEPVSVLVILWHHWPLCPLFACF